MDNDTCISPVVWYLPCFCHKSLVLERVRIFYSAARQEMDGICELFVLHGMRKLAKCSFPFSCCLRRALICHFYLDISPFGLPLCSIFWQLKRKTQLVSPFQHPSSCQVKEFPIGSWRGVKGRVRQVIDGFRRGYTGFRI